MKTDLLLPRLVANILFLFTAPVCGYYFGCIVGNRYDLESKILSYYFCLFTSIVIFLLLIENIFANIYKIENRNIINVICIFSNPISLVSYGIIGSIIGNYLPYEAKWLPIKGPYGFVTADFIAHMFFILLPIIILDVYYFILHRKAHKISTTSMCSQSPPRGSG